MNADNTLSEIMNTSSNNNLNLNEDIDNNKLELGKSTFNLGKMKTFNVKNIEKKDNSIKRRTYSGNIKQIKLGVLSDFSDLPKINLTVYLRLYTEHCLYWACYFNYNDKIINMFLSLYNARPAFPLFCLNNRTSLHAACIQGSLIPFQLVYKTYELKRKKKLKLDIKSDKKIPVTLSQSDENKNIKIISYPKEYNKYKKILLSNKHFNSLNKKFRKYK